MLPSSPCSHRRPLTLSRTRALSLSRENALALSRSRALALSRTHSVVRSRSRCLERSLSRAFALSRAIALARLRTRALALPRARALAHSRTLGGALSTLTTAEPPGRFIALHSQHRREGCRLPRTPSGWHFRCSSTGCLMNSTVLWPLLDGHRLLGLTNVFRRRKGLPFRGPRIERLYHEVYYNTKIHL